MNLIAELRRRRVFRAAGLYLVVAWVVIQVADTVMPRLGLPDWGVTFVIVVAALGLPIALVLAWLYDFTGQGIERTATADPSTSAQLSAASRATGLIGLGMVIALVVFGAYWRLQPRDEPTGDVNSVAVLPFVDMSPNKDQEYFGDGITEEILNVLAQLPGLKVPARTSSFSFKGKNLPIRDVARQLGVANILEGSIRKSGDQVRITAQLIDAANDRHLWSQTYDRKLSDVFAVQDEIAHAIVEALELHMKGNKPLAEKETGNAVAHEHYLKGLYYWNGRRTDEMPKALAEFQAAAQADPAYARAHAGIALTYAVLRQYVQSTDRETAIREGKAAAARALQLDPHAADAHAALSQIAQTMEWDWRAAEAHADTAVALDPQYATGHQWRAEVLGIQGRMDEALREADLALAIDPLSGVMQNVKGWLLEMTGRTEEAKAIYLRVIEQNPKTDFSRGNLVALALRTHDYDTAEKFALPDDAGVKMLMEVMKDTSKRPAFMKKLGSPQTRAVVDPGSLASVYMMLGEPDSAAAFLNRAADVHEPTVEDLAQAQLFQPLRNRPAFQEFLRKLGMR